MTILPSYQQTGGIKIKNKASEYATRKCCGEVDAARGGM
jgi:hypothetical protein